MMTKIIGAAMIVSGAFLGGRGYVNELQKNGRACETLCATLGAFKTALYEQRCSFHQYLDRLEPTVLEEAEPSVRSAVIQLSEQLKTASYEESCNNVATLHSELENRCRQYEQELTSKKKAVPLVAGCVGFLVAVMLF